MDALARQQQLQTNLAGLADRAGFVPKPEAFDKRLEPGFRGGKALFTFFLLNAIPFGGLLYYLREQSSQRAQFSLLALPSSADDVVGEALRIVRTAATCFLVQQPSSEYAGVLRVDPHPPEGTAFAPPTEPLPLVPNMERNVLTDLLESPVVPGLGFIQFAVSANSSFGRQVAAGHRRASLLYTSNSRGAYCTISGQLSVLADPESRRRYWKNAWFMSFPPLPSPAPLGAVVSAAGKPSAPSTDETPQPWLHPDYILVRLAVDEATLHTVVDGPQRWEQRRVVRQQEGKLGSTGGVGNWALAPEASS